jgi:hypothetical protein
MAKLLACLLGMLVSLQAGQAPAAADKPKDEKCSIEGRVVNSVTGEAVRRVSLRLRLVSPSAGSTSGFTLMESIAAESDESGGFAFRDLNCGRYNLGASRTGFASQE